MLKNSAEEFFAMLKTDKSLQNEFMQMLKDSGDLSEDDIANKIIKFANKQGYDFSLEELKTHLKGVYEDLSKELTDDELSEVSGGAWFLFAVAAIIAVGVPAAILGKRRMNEIEMERQRKRRKKVE